MAEIKAAYSSQLNQFRERQNTHDRPEAAALDSLNLAFRTLRDPDARQAYDAGLDRAQFRPGAGNPARPELDSPDSLAYRFQFCGDGGAYFRIWMVNAFLSILTLGIYSAWAKVRREQYFHRNLLLDGSAFDYHGKPLAILKGRLLATLLVGGLSAAQHTGPKLYGLALFCLVPLVPWLAVKALRFRAHNTSYRGLRFGFDGSYGAAFKAFVGYGILVPFTFGLAFPLFYRQVRLFILGNMRFGTTPFRCTVGAGQIYGVFLLPAIMFLGGFLILVIMAGAQGSVREASMVVFLPFVLMLVIQAFAIPYIAVNATNLMWGATTLDNHRFSSDLPLGGYIRLTLANWLGIVGTLGLFIPWARVRTARFRAEHLELEIRGSLESFVAGESEAVSAIGDEASELFDLDIGL